MTESRYHPLTHPHLTTSIIHTASEMEESEETAGTSAPNKNGAPPLPPEASTVNSMAITGANGGMEANGAGELGELNFDEADDSKMLSHAARNAQAAMFAAQNKAKQFDQMYANEQAQSKENYDLEGMEAAMENGGDAAMKAMTSTSGDKQMKDINSEYIA